MANSMNDLDSAVTHLCLRGRHAGACGRPFDDTQTLVWVMSTLCPIASASRSQRKDSGALRSYGNCREGISRDCEMMRAHMSIRPGPALGERAVHQGPVVALDQRVGQVAERRVGQQSLRQATTWPPCRIGLFAQAACCSPGPSPESPPNSRRAGSSPCNGFNSGPWDGPSRARHPLSVTILCRTEFKASVRLTP